MVTALPTLDMTWTDFRRHFHPLNRQITKPARDWRGRCRVLVNTKLLSCCLGLMDGRKAASAIVAGHIQISDLQKAISRDPKHSKPWILRGSRVFTMYTCWGGIDHPDLSINRFLLFTVNGILMHHAVTQNESTGRQLIHQRAAWIQADKQSYNSKQQSSSMTAILRNWSSAELG